MDIDKKIKFFDERRDLVIPGDKAATILFSTEHFIQVVKEGQQARGMASVALAGGTTPKAIFEMLSSPKYRDRVDWKKLLIFWSDERCVPPNHPDSNYKMAMDAGFASLPIPKENIFRMPADASDLDAAAMEYENAIIDNIPNGAFDLIMLGMGDDGHTASLFPKTHGLHADTHLVIANFLDQKNIWRMSFTYSCINAAHHIAIYVMGKSKDAMIKLVLEGPYEPDLFPVQRVGTPNHKALWIIDQEAANLLRTYE